MSRRTATVVAAALAAGAGCFRIQCEAPAPDAGGAPEATYATCMNGVDDDLDGAIDCADDACSAWCGGCLPGPCEPGFARCVEGTNAVLECLPDGASLCPVGFCGAEQVCQGFTCAPTRCIGADRLCDGTGRWNRCLAATWIGPLDCPAGEVCDPTQGDACQPVTCPPGGPFCPGPTERADCTPYGVQDGDPEPCPGGGTCEAGLCTGPCDEPGACEYLFVEIERPPGDDGGTDWVLVSNRGPWSSNVRVEAHGESGWVVTDERGVGVGGTAYIELPERRPAGTVLSGSLAMRLVSDVPVTVHVRDDLAWATHFSAAYTPWPTSRLGTDYRLAGWPHQDTADEEGTPGSHPGGLAVIATADGTMVTVEPAASTAGGGAVPPLAPGVPWTGALDAGHVLTLTTAAVGDDLTGTRVLASAPVAVLAFHLCATLDGVGCDKMAELLPPVARWGTDHVVAVGGASEVVRVVGAASGTNVTVAGECASGAGGTIGAGEWLEIVTPAAPPAAGSCALRVTSSAPVLVALVSGPAASLMAVRPTDTGVPGAGFAASPWPGTLRLARIAPGAVTIDGGATPIPWVAGPDGAEVAAVPLEMLGLHVLEVAATGASLVAFVVGEAGGNGFQITSWSYDTTPGW